MERQRGFETRRLVIVIFLFGVLALPLFFVAGCGKQLTRMEENQVKLQAMVAANARDLATISSQLHTGQGKINESIQTLDGDTQQVAAGVTTVRNEQRQFRDTVAAGHEGLDRRITQVQDSQGSLQAGVAQVSEVTQRTAADLTALARDQATLQETVQANQRELAGSLGTVVNNQQRIQTSLGDLHQSSQGLAADIASLSAKSDTLHATVQDNNRQLGERLAVLAAGHGQLSADVSNVRTLLQTAATDLTAANSSLKEQLGATGERLTAQITGLSASQQQLQSGLDALGGKAEQTVADLADTKASLQETLRVSREVLTGQMAASLRNQETLQSDVRDLGDKADKLTTQQQSLSEAVKANQDVVTAKFTDVSQAQTTLQSSVNGLEDKTEAIVSAQSNLRQTLQSHNEAMNAGVAELAKGQQTLQTQMEAATATTSQTALDVLALNNQQTALQQAVRAVEDNLTGKMGQTLAAVKGMAEQQASLQQSLTANNHTQEQMKTDLGTLATTAGQTSLDVLAMKDSQAGLAQAMKTTVADLGTRTDKVAADLTAVAAGQRSLNDALNHQGQAASSQMARIAESQQQLQSGMDTLTATAGQTALDVMAMTARQDAIQTALQSHDGAFGTQMAKLADGQQQMQSGLDIVTATAGQASLDALALSDSQDKLGQALQAGRQDVADRLAAMAQSQQNWSERLDNAQTKVATIADRIAALEQQIAKLQTVLQTGLQGTATVLGTTGQQRQQFEAKVTQDVQAVIDSLSHLRQMQVALQEQITQVQRSTQGQADSLRSVIEQMKATPSAADRTREQTPAAENQTGVTAPAQPPAEVKVSSATETPQAPEVEETQE